MYLNSDSVSTLVLIFVLVIILTVNDISSFHYEISRRYRKVFKQIVDCHIHVNVSVYVAWTHALYLSQIAKKRRKKREKSRGQHNIVFHKIY